MLCSASWGGHVHTHATLSHRGHCPLENMEDPPPAGYREGQNGQALRLAASDPGRFISVAGVGIRRPDRLAEVLAYDSLLVISQPKNAEHRGLAEGTLPLLNRQLFARS